MSFKTVAGKSWSDHAFHGKGPQIELKDFAIRVGSTSRILAGLIKHDPTSPKPTGIRHNVNAYSLWELEKWWKKQEEKK